MNQINKRGYFAGWRTVFSFSFGRQLRSKVYIALTITVALLLFSGVFALLFFTNSDYIKNSSPTESTLERVTVCDGTGEFGDAAWLPPASPGLFENTVFESGGRPDDALAASDKYDLVLVITKEDGQYRLGIVKPDGTSISSAEISEFSGYVSTAFRAELIRRSGIDPSALAWLAAPVTTNTATTSDIGADPAGAMRKNIGMAVSYVTIFIMYLLTLLYGQGAASSVILEKTSRLMDFFLVSVKPAAMILGKVLSAAAAAFLQIAIWLAAFIGGLRLGLAALTALYGSVSPDIESLTGIFEGIGAMFSPGGIVVALLMIAAGFLLYCSLAAIGGAMASKPEDLSSTNMVFALTVVASFLLSISSGSSGGMVSTEKWLIYFPFTAIMVTPGRAMTGDITLAEGLISVALVALLAFAVIILAGRVYELMSFYRGNPPTPAKIFGILRESLGRKKPKNS